MLQCRKPLVALAFFVIGFNMVIPSKIGNSIAV